MKGTVTTIVSMSKTLVVLPLTVLVTLVILWVITPFYIGRQLVQILGRILQPNLIRLVSRRSAVWTADSLHVAPVSNITIVTTFDTKVSPDLLRSDFLAKTIPKYPRLQHHFVVWLGYSFWKWDDPFDIQDHLREDHRLVIGQQDLINRANTINGQGWIPCRSPWSLVHIEYKAHAQAEVTSVLIFNIHHALSDAFGAQCILRSVVGNKEPSPPYNDISLPTCQPAARPWGWAMYVASIYALVQELVTLKDFNALKQCKVRNKERSIAYYSRSLKNRLELTVPSEKLEWIQDRFQVSGTAVMCSLAGGALERICALEQIEPPTFVHLMVPYSIPEHSRDVTNHQGFVFVRVPVQGKTFPERLKSVEGEVKRQRETGMWKLFEIAIPLVLGLLPVPVIKYLYTVNLSTGMLISIKIQDRISFRGATVTDISFISGPLPGDQAFFFFFMEYARTFKIGIGLNTGLKSAKMTARIVTEMAEEVELKTVRQALKGTDQGKL